MTTISILDASDEEDYTVFLHKSRESMLFHSMPYKRVLQDFLLAKPFYIIAREKDKILGAIPAFLKENKEYGNVINSLPFIGSNGGVIVDSSLDYMEKLRIKKELLNAFQLLATEEDCILSTIITSPFDRDVIFYEDNINYSYRDHRICYIKEFNRSFCNPKEAILSTVEKRCRNSIKRSKKNIKLEYSDNFCDLAKLHRRNIEGKGNFKPFQFFDLIKKNFDNNEYELSYALIDNKIIAGLLVFYFKDTVEYFTPAFDFEYRAEQATSFLIYEAMKKSIKSGFKYWNFGGTTIPSQMQVAYFKKSWGSYEYPYYYYIIKHQNIESILSLDEQEIARLYKWFYVIPFEELKAEVK